MNLSPRAMKRLAQQQQKYFASLELKRERILTCWQGIQIRGWKCRCFADFKTEVHRLSGSAASYGLEELGRAARDLDVLLGSRLEITVDTTNIVELVDNLLAELDHAVSLYNAQPG